MLGHTTRDVLGRAAYMRRTCELLLSQLREVDAAVTGTEHLTPMQEADIEKAAVDHAERASEHLDLASQFIDNWHRALDRAFRREL
jgi:hypothetical protein